MIRFVQAYSWKWLGKEKNTCLRAAELKGAWGAKGKGRGRFLTNFFKKNSLPLSPTCTKGCMLTTGDLCEMTDCLWTLWLMFISLLHLEWVLFFFLFPSRKLGSFGCFDMTLFKWKVSDFLPLVSAHRCLQLWLFSTDSPFPLQL